MSYKIERGVLIPKDKLHPNPWNPNHMKPRQQEAVSESIKHYGQVMELLVRPHPEIEEEYQIIDGEHRYNILPAEVYCNVIHGLPDAEAKKLTIVMNETRGSADKIELAQLLSEIKDDLGDDLGLALPYEENELEELIKLSEVDWDQFDEDVDDPFEENAEGDGDTGWNTITIKISDEAMDVVKQAKDLIEEAMDNKVKDAPIQWGLILEYLAADYLGK